MARWQMAWQIVVVCCSFLICNWCKDVEIRMACSSSFGAVWGSDFILLFPVPAAVDKKSSLHPPCTHRIAAEISFLVRVLTFLAFDVFDVLVVSGLVMFLSIKLLLEQSFAICTRFSTCVSAWGLQRCISCISPDCGCIQIQLRRSR